MAKRPLFERSGRWLVAVAAGASLACAARRAPEPPPPPPAEPIVAEPEISPEQRRIERAITLARAEYRLGVEAQRAGRHEEARARFDNALVTLLDVPRGAETHPLLGEAFSELVESIHAVELESFHNGNRTEYAEAPIDQLEQIEPEITAEKAEEERALVEEAEASYDVPVVLNDKVLAWIEVYSGRMRDQYEPGLRRSGRYLEMMRGILREEGLPEDLVYMAHVESAWKTRAYSRARAKGIWQFISSTGRRYGLRRDWWLDERSDPELSARAAAAYLKDLYAMFGDWYLAMAAYNAGEGKVKRAIRRTGSRDFWKIARTRHLRRETRNYVPAILATMVISKSPEKFGFTTEKDPPLEYDTVRLDRPIDLRVAAKAAGTTLEDMKRLNPALYRMQTPPNYPDFPLRVPPGSGEAFRIVEASLKDSERLLATYHRVRRGETLSSIARRYGVSVSALTSANGIRNRHRISVGKVLTVPTSHVALGGHPDRVTSSRASRSSSSNGKVTYQVRRGDTLYSIARRYRTTVSALRSANGMGRHEVLRAGRRLVIHPGVRSIKGQRVTHKVRRGDTLTRIASRYGSTVDDICRWNNISRNSILRVGTRLVLYR